MWKVSLLCFFLFSNIMLAHGGITTNKTHVARLLLIGSWGNPATNRFTNLVQFATWLLNNQDDILPDVEIEIVTQNCGSGSGNPAKCLQLGINSITQGNITGLVTGSYSNDQRILQYMAAAFNIPQISGVTSGNLLSNKNDYPTFLRTVPTDAQTNRVMIDLMIRNGWKHAVVPLEDGDYGTGNRDVLQRLAYENNITLMFVLCPTGGKDFTKQAEVIKSSGYHIILSVLNFRETWVFADAANRTGLLTSDYVWILPPAGSVSPGLAAVDQPSLPWLNLRGLRTLLAGALSIVPHGGSGPLYDAYSPIWDSPEGLTRFPVVPGRPIAGSNWCMFDALWSYAIAMDLLMKNGTPFENVKETLLLRRLQTLNFTGITGQVTFDANGDRVGFLDVLNYNDTTGTLVLAYNPYTKLYTEIGPITYLEGRVDTPSDILACQCVNQECVQEAGCVCAPCPKEVHIRPWNKGLSGGLGAIVAIGFFIAAFAIVMLGLHWSDFSKHGSFYSALIISGVILSYVSAATLLPEPSEPICIVFPWLLCLAFTLVYGCLFVKTWALYKVWRCATEMKLTSLKASDVLKIIFGFLALEVIYLIVWTTIDPPKPKLVEMVDGSYTYTCASKTPIFWSVTLGYKVLWLIIGAVLSVLTRNVSTDYSESRSIAYATYNNIMLCLLAVPLVIVLEAIPGGTLIIEVTVIVLAFTFTMCILFFNIWYDIFFPNSIDINLTPGSPSRSANSHGQSGRSSHSSTSPIPSAREKMSTRSGIEVTTDV